MYEMNLAHYRDRMGVGSNDTKWMERGLDILIADQGFEQGGTPWDHPSWGGLTFRRVSPGDPIQGFVGDTPDFGMHALPTTIEAENYDFFALAGEGRTYHDLSLGNSGQSYRSADGVDLGSASEGGYALTSIESGEWVTYTVSAPSAGNYDIRIRYASTASGGTIQFEFDGADGTGAVGIPHGSGASTGASDWQDLVIATGVPLSRGVQQLRINFGGTSNTFALNHFTIDKGFDAFAIIEAEDFDDQYGIDTQVASEGGLNVQRIQNGDWCAYHNVDFGSGADEFQARVASATSGGNIEVRLGSPTGTLVASCLVENTTGWQTYETVSTSVSGVSGKHDVYLVFTGGSGYLYNVNWFTFTPAPYTLTYTAGAGGSISGSSQQEVLPGASGSAVTAVANSGYTFVNWSDGSTDNPRTDLNITGDLSVTVNFTLLHTALETWRFTHFETHDNTGEAADDHDADLDGIVNLLEYATGTDPNNPSGPPLRAGPNTTGSEMELTFNRIPDPSLNYFIEGTDELGSAVWDPVWSGTGTSADTVTIPEAVWPSGHSHYFFRLGVSY